MQSFDVVVVGAGPAGGHCARLLAKLGYQVLLVEQHEDFQRNNFSSAASPLITLEQYNLPESVVSRYWQNIEILSTNIHRSWQAKQPLGVVFDFAKLREFLAQEAENNGGVVWLGCRYLKYFSEDGKTTVFLQRKGSEPFTVNTKLLVDATGYSRTVIYSNKKDKPSFLKGIGIEYLIQIDEKVYQKYSNSLIFFLGYQWSPQGYSWIFPMSNNQLKVGTAILEGKHKIIQKTQPIKEYIHKIIKNYINLDEYQVLDIHGSILDYSPGLNDIYYKEQVLAIGDTVSTVNFLGGEGIRYAMKSAEVACRYIEDYIQNNHQDFRSYESEMKQYFSRRWNWSEQISRKVYLEYSDARIDQGVSYLRYLSLDDIIDILFYYKFEKYTKGLKGLLFRKIQNLLQHIQKKIIYLKLVHFMSKITSYTLLATLLSILTACSGNNFLEGRFAPDPNLKSNPTPTITPEVGSTPTTNSLPTEIPQYPSAKLLSIDPNNTENQGKTQWVSPDPINQIGEFYQQQFQDNNWLIITPFSAEQGNNTIVASREGLQTTITLQGTSSETQFSIDYQREGRPVSSNPTPSPTITPNQLPTQQSVNFSDLAQVPNPLQSHIQDLGILGILTAQNADLFRPNTAITRREFVRWLVRANNTFYQNDPGKQIRLGETTSQSAFQDVNISDPDFPYIQGLAEAGIIPSRLTGDNNALLFRPTAVLTREVLVTWKVPFDLRKGLPTATMENVKETWGFQDVSKVDPKALRSLYADYQNGDQAIIRRVFGYTTLFQPKKAVTRAEAASTLWYFGYQGEGMNAEEVLQAKNQTQPTQ